MSRPIRFMKTVDAVAYVAELLKTAANQRDVTVAMLDDDARQKMAVWICDNFRS